ncbi:MAG TPA: hypothetical protein VEY50_09755 [Lysobacter sp.]|nr:hypothetical protein [Lysobacter sp.]
MRQSSSVVWLGLALWMGAGAVTPPATPAVAVEQALDRAALERQLEAAIAGEFRPRALAVDVERLEIAPLSLRDRRLRGGGRLRFDDAGPWLDFGFDAGYDIGIAQLTELRLSLAAREGADEAPPQLRAALRETMQRALAAEFAGQPVAFELDALAVQGVDARHHRIDARGHADFAAEGRAPLQISAVWDAPGARWRHLTYRLGETPAAPR